MGFINFKNIIGLKNKKEKQNNFVKLITLLFCFFDNKRQVSTKKLNEV